MPTNDVHFLKVYKKHHSYLLLLFYPNARAYVFHWFVQIFLIKQVIFHHCLINVILRTNLVNVSKYYIYDYSNSCFSFCRIYCFTLNYHNLMKRLFCCFFVIYFELEKHSNNSNGFIIQNCFKRFSETTNHSN